ncbi:TPA: hypothetical protein DEP96_03265 [Candidatus Uhrbacteria bacterium]|nr:hypothetical protein [Candidatus Uhrbacteria bacterium]
MTVFLLPFLALFTTSAAAGTSAQINVKAAGSAKLVDKIDLGVFANAMLLPGTTAYYCAYAGPGFQLTPWWWTSPRGGVILNWPSTGQASPIASLWNYVTFYGGDLSLFLETEVYARPGGGVDYFGFYQLDYHFKALSLGLLGEQLNTGVTAGPVVTYAFNEHLSSGVEYHFNPVDLANQTIRFNLSLKFN